MYIKALVCDKAARKRAMSIVPVTPVLVLVFVLLLLAKLLHDYYIIDRKLKKGFACPPGLPLFGHTFDLLPTSLTFNTLSKYHQTYGDLLHIQATYFNPFVSICDLESIKQILHSKECLTKASFYKVLGNWLGNGLGCATGSKWHKMRKTLQPAFTLQSLIGFINIFNSRYSRLIEHVEKGNIGKEIEITRLFNLCSLDVVCESTLGVLFDANIKETSDFLEKSNRIISIIIKRTFHPWRMSELLYFFTRDKWLERAYVKSVRDYTKTIIRARRKAITNHSFSGNNNQSFIDILLSSDFDGRLLTDEEICDEINLFVFAGHETVAYSLAYLFRLLAKHQDIQERVVDELRGILSNDKSRALHFKDLQDMKYLDMVIKEALRLYPPVGIIGRRFENDQMFNDLLIPGNIDVIINVSALHRNAKYFPDPETFNPERFRNEGKMDAFMPFSAGPRNCIGHMFATLQIKSAAANILRKLKVHEDNSPEPFLYFDVTIKPKGGIKVTFEKRIF